MKKSVLIVLMIVLSVVIVSQPTEANSTNYFTTIHDKVPVFDYRTGKPEIVAFLAKDQTFKIESDYNKSLYRVEIGNEYGYVSKRNTKRVTGIPTLDNLSIKENTNTMIITNRTTLVHEKNGKYFKIITSIKSNRRYPIFGEEGVWYKVYLGGRIGYIKKSNVSIDTGIPVLMYHHILSDSENVNFKGVSTTISDTDFNNQMDYLKKNGYVTITMSDFKKFVSGKLNLPGKAVLITFDDGLKSSLIYAYPKLKQNGFKAVQFIITGRIKQTRTFDPNSLQFLSNDEMKEMSNVFSYSNHTNSMHDLDGRTSYVIGKPYSEVKDDISKAQTFLENDTSEIAFPFGQYNESTIQMLKELKFTAAFTTKSGKVKVGDNMLELKRQGIGPRDTIKTFADKVSN